jgi:PAS domain S-box-containing protein
MIVLDTQNRIVDLNQPAQIAFNIPLDALVGKNLIEVAPFSRAVLDQNIEREIKTEFEVEVGNGAKRYFDALISPLREENKANIGHLIIFRDITERRQVEEKLRQRTYELNERVKELNCLFGISELVRTPGISLEGIFQGIVDLIPPAWQFPDRTCARLTVEGQIFSTANFNETTWKQASEIILNGKQVGILEVCYLGDQLTGNEGFFLKEEQLLLSAITERIGRVIERRQAEAALRQREADFREVFNETAHGIFIIDVLEDGNFRIGNSNKAEEIATSIRRENVQGKLLEDVFPPEIAQTIRANYNRCIEAGTVIAYEEEIELSPARRRYYHTTLAPVRDETGRFYRIIGSTLDITNRKRVEKMMMQQLHEIQELHQNLEQAQIQLVEQQREIAAMEERQRIARNLHDSLSQSIHSLGLFSETLAAAIDKNDLGRAKQVLMRVQESAQQSHKETRLLLYELQNPNTERVTNLVQALEERLEKVERHARVKAQLVQEGSLEYCPQEWYENLFWITIEALNNALKHAFARKVQVRLRCSPQRMELEVSDDGKGFDVAEVQTGGMGLDNLRTRAGLIGGELIIESQPEKGTTVRFSADIPVAR